MGGVGEPPPPPIPPPPIPDKRKAQIITNPNKSLKNNNGIPVQNNINQNNSKDNSPSTSANSPQIEHNYNSLANTNIRYPPHHPGPFFVLAKSEAPISSNRRNCELHAYVRFRRIGIPNNYVCKNIAYNTFRMTFNNFNAANVFADNPKLADIGLKAEIPDRFVQRFFIIKNVPTEISGICIKDSIEANNDIEVISVYRFSRRNERNETVPSETIKIGLIFDGPLPDIFMCGTLVHPELYVPPLRQCLNCGRLGHTAIRC